MIKWWRGVVRRWYRKRLIARDHELLVMMQAGYRLAQGEHDVFTKKDYTRRMQAHAEAIAQYPRNRRLILNFCNDGWRVWGYRK